MYEYMDIVKPNQILCRDTSKKSLGDNPKDKVLGPLLKILGCDKCEPADIVCPVPAGFITR